MVLTPMDWVVIGLVAVFGVLGLLKGLIRELFSIASHVVAIVASFRFYPAVHSTIGGIFPKQYQPYGKFVSFILVYIVVLLVFFIIERMLLAVVSALHLKTLDRILGLAFGAAKGLLIATVAFIVVTSFFPSSEKAMEKGVTYPILKRTSAAVIQLSPGKFKHKFLSRGFLLGNFTGR